MENKKLELRMYGFVPYNLSDIQQGIQFGHSVVEFMTKHFFPEGTPPYRKYMDWANNWKTFIILNGGTTNNNKDSEWYGSLNQIKDELLTNIIPFSYFEEPDLGNQLTAITFICDERVFNYKDYPDFKDYLLNELNDSIQYLKEADTSDSPESMRKTNILLEEIKFIKRNKIDFEKEYGKLYKIWIAQVMGGKENVYLRELLKGKKLA